MQINLFDQVLIGKEAEKAYTNYLKAFFSRYEQELLQKFKLANHNDDRYILSIKTELLYINNIQAAIETEISNGKIADKQLQGEQNGNDQFQR